ncbi:nucleotidyltransferase [Candidatus Poribacteria bacterium]|nr:nucleotidyltransferase [Candidatus Poribacteria bacterium]
MKQTLVDNREILKKYGVRQIGLFGSYVNGTAHATSDIDLLVELERSTFQDYMELVLFIENLFEKKVDLVAVESVKSDLKPYIEKQVEYVANL